MIYRPQAYGCREPEKISGFYHNAPSQTKPQEDRNTEKRDMGDRPGDQYAECPDEETSSEAVQDFVLSNLVIRIPDRSTREDVSAGLHWLSQ
jgi:hypothetical protein